MGSRKRISAEARKEEKRNTVMARLHNHPTSPRKMRLIADLIRGVDVKRALDILKYTEKAQAKTLEKLLLSAISNWQVKNEGVRIEDANLYVKEIYVDSASMLKRLRPAPQGRAYRIRKRSNHVTLILGSKINQSQTQNQEA
ncbi:MAG: 50S ribosomal protein L22 [Bacteroidales bacterium]|nr:50S ribosomal protein L22 [Bacteroidales bacterium]